jgi:branched-subunit amino acid aminotransferase/4-amino-4-deoxychorismate lyase
LKILTDSHITLHSLSPLNRGKWTFTSFVSLQSEFVNLKEHVSRLCQGADFLFPEVGWLQKQTMIIEYLQTLFKPQTYYRINICEENLWVYHSPHEMKPLFVKLKLAESRKALTCLPHYLKCPNYLLSDIEVTRAKINHCDDVLFLDEDHFVAEASTSNVFFLTKNSRILTPVLSSAVLSGIMREQLIIQLKQLGKSVHEEKIQWCSGQFLDEVDEIWMTNSVSGLRFVTDFEGRKFNFEGSFLSTFLKKFDRYGRVLE